MSTLAHASSVSPVPLIPPAGPPIAGPVGPTLVLPSPTEIQGEIEHVLNKQLSPDLIRWVDGYAQVGKRNLYLWKWVRQGIEVTALSSVQPDLYDFACDTKVM